MYRNYYMMYKHYYKNYMMVCGIDDIITVCLLFFVSAPMCFARSNSTPHYNLFKLYN